MIPIDLVLSKLTDAKKVGHCQWRARCSAHDDSDPSLSIGLGDDGRVLLHCFGGCAPESIVAALGLTMADLMPSGSTGPPSQRKKSNAPAGRPRRSKQSGKSMKVYPTAREAVEALEQEYGPRSADWTYSDLDGEPVSMVIRWNKATGKVIRPVSRNGSGWSACGMTEPRPLYELPSLLNSNGGRVFVGEGEKVADALRAVGLQATTSPHGSKSAKKADWSPLAGREVVILPDNDDAGERYADDVAELLSKLTPVPMVRRVTLPDLPAKGDTVDFIEARRAAGVTDDAIRAEIEALADATGSATLLTPRPSAPGYKPFPHHALPEPMRAYIIPRSRRMDVDPIFLIAPALSMFAGAVGNSARVVVREGWIEPCCVWTGVLALPGSLKTQTQDAVIRPMLDAQRRADKEYDDRMREYEAACSEREALKKQAKGKPANSLPPLPEEPVRRQWLVGDTTPEALAHVLKANPRGVVAVYDELGALFGGFGRYSKSGTGAEPGAAFFKSAFNGKTHIENRKGENGRGKYIRIESPLVSIAGALQPEAFQRLITRQYVEDGLASRFLWAWPPDRPGGWVDDVADDSDSGPAYAAAYARLCSIPLKIAADGALQPMNVGLSRPAQDLARSWVNDLRERIINAPDGAVRAALAKLKGMVFRVALLFHLTDWAATEVGSDPGAISRDTLRRAIVVVDWFADEAIRVYAMHQESSEEGEARRLRDWIAGREGTVTARELAHGQRRFRNDPDSAKRALDELVSACWGKWEDVQGEKGGRPTERFRLISHVTVTETSTPPERNEGFGDGDSSSPSDGWGAEGEL
ncbi:MAG: DUF3987 domain-containing protein [Phycisphaeraceae bacterium]